MHTDEQRIKAANLRYEEAMHAVQTGILATMAVRCGMQPNQTNMRRADQDPHLGEASPKHLRTGISSCMVTDKALATLLLAKGVFTEVEFHEAIAKAAEDERTMYETTLGLKLG